MLWIALHFYLYGAEGFVDERLSGYAALGKAYQLTELNGAPFEEAQLLLPSKWRLELRTACTTYRAKLMVAYPWFEATTLRPDQPGCASDAALLEALGQMTLVEVSGPVILFSSPGNGVGLEFRAQP